MKRHSKTAVGLILTLLVVVPGCGKKDKEAAPSSEQIEAQTKVEAKDMDTDQLMENAEKCKEQYMAKQSEINLYVLKLENLTPEERAAGEAQRVNVELDKLQNSMSVLKTKFLVYYDALEARGVDVSELLQ